MIGSQKMEGLSARLLTVRKSNLAILIEENLSQISALFLIIISMNKFFLDYRRIIPGLIRKSSSF